MAFVAQLCNAPTPDFAERLAALLDTEVINVFKAQGRYNVLNHADVKHWCDIPRQGLPQALSIAMTPKKKHDPVAAEQNRAHMLQMIRDPDGTVSAGGYSAAVEVRRRLVDEIAARLRSDAASTAPAGKPAAAPSSPMRAQAAEASLPLLAGLPATPAGWTNLSGYTHPVGRINDLLIDNVGMPSTRTLWAGSDGGGIWKSADGGTTWNPINDFGGSLSIGRILRSPRNSNEMYASTNPRGSHTYAPFGIMKSNDGGITWAQLASTNPATSPDWEYVTHLAIHPVGVGGADVLLAATDTGAFQSTNSGASWTRLSAANISATHVGFHPLDGNRRAYALRDARLVVTTNGDFANATTYTVLAGADYSFVKFAFASSDVNVLYALAASSIATGNVSNLLRSANGGATWTALTPPSNFFYNTLFFTGALWVDPANPNHIAVVEAAAASTTNATTATATSGWSLANTYWIDHHNVVADPGFNGTTNKIVYTMDDGGLYRFNDVDNLTGGTYLATGMTVTEVYSVAGRGGNIILGAQDVSPRVYRANPPGDLTQRWRFVGYPAACNGCVWIGDGATTAVGRINGDILYGSRQLLDLFVSTDGGLNGVPICGTAPNNLAEGRCASNGTTPFIAPLAIDPNNAGTLFAGGDGVWRGTNLTSGVPLWTKIHADQSIYYPTAIAVAPTDSHTAWVAYETGKVFKTANALAATPTWTQVAGVPAGTKLKIFIDRFNPNIVYLGLAGFSGAKLYVTINGGTSWNAATGLPAASVFAMEQHPKNASWLYAGTAVGLFASIDGGATWSANNEGPANVHVRDLSWYSEGTIADLLVATFGRGVWRASIQAGSGTSLTVTKAGTQTGRVTSSPAGIYCGTVCSNLFDAASMVTLTAAATTGAFTGWSGGGCSGTGSCVVTMSAAQSVTATFNQLGTGGPGVIQFAQSGYSVSEGSTAMLSVTRTGGNAGAVSVTYATGANTAVPPGDFASQLSSLTWADGDGAPKTIAIPINVDGLPEGNETFTVTLSSATGGATISSPVFATVTIIDLEAPPGAPTITSAVAGITTATIYFSAAAPAPLFSPLTPSYVARCVGPDTRLAGASGSPIVVLGLTTGATYLCDVTAQNFYGSSPPSASATVVPSLGAPPGLLNVWSRKRHGGTDYNLDINETQAISGIVSVEPRIGNGHLIVFRFEATVTSASSVTVTDFAGMPIGTPPPNFVGDELQVLLTGIPDNRRINITVTNVNGGATRSAAMGFLAGDVNGFRSVNASDITAIKARVNQPVGAGNFRFDLNASGTIDASDVTIAKAHSGQSLAP